MSNMNSDVEQYTVIDTKAVEWDKSFNPKLGVDLELLILRKDPNNRAEIRMIRYPKAIANPEHTHPCGHGIFALEGNLRTHKGTYGPGAWVWFPEGETMEQGATDEADMIGILIIEKTFEIFYKDEE